MVGRTKKQKNTYIYHTNQKSINTALHYITLHVCKVNQTCLLTTCSTVERFNGADVEFNISLDS